MVKLDGHKSFFNCTNYDVVRGRSKQEKEGEHPRRAAHTNCSQEGKHTHKTVCSRKISCAVYKCKEKAEHQLQTHPACIIGRTPPHEKVSASRSRLQTEFQGGQKTKEGINMPTKDLG